MAKRSKMRTVKATVYYHDRSGRIFGERNFPSCSGAKAFVAGQRQFPGVRAKVVCKKRR